MRNKAIICVALASTLALANIKTPKLHIQKPFTKAIRIEPIVNNFSKYNTVKSKKISTTHNRLLHSIKKRGIHHSKHYTKADLNLLARVIYAEVGDESDKAQLLVANVVINRVESKYKEFPNTIKEVVYQTHPRQYECVANGSINKKPSAKAIKNAKRILEGERFCPKSVTYQSEYILGSGIYTKIGRTYFCYDD